MIWQMSPDIFRIPDRSSCRNCLQDLITGNKSWSLKPRQLDRISLQNDFGYNGTTCFRNVHLLRSGHPLAMTSKQFSGSPPRRHQPMSSSRRFAHLDRGAIPWTPNNTFHELHVTRLRLYSATTWAMSFGKDNFSHISILMCFRLGLTRKILMRLSANIVEYETSKAVSFVNNARDSYSYAEQYAPLTLKSENHNSNHHDALTWLQ